MAELIGVTIAQLQGTSAALAADPELRKQVEDDLRSELPDGYDFHIDADGIGHLYTPVIRTRVIDLPKEDDAI